MSTKEWLPEFLGEFHRDYMKPQGFRKNGRTFSRDMGAYWERFNFQGSKVNYAGVESWRFYINAGVEFKDLAPRDYWTHFAHTHLAARLEALALDAPRHWEYNTRTDRVKLARRLFSLIMEASRKMAARVDKAREMYLAGDVRGAWWR